MAVGIEAYYIASFGGIRLWCSRVSTTNGRKLVVHDPARGDEHPLQDRGLETRVTSCTLLFDEMDGETTSPRERFDRFAALVEEGEPQVFTHPLRGSYLARVGRFDHEVDEASNISAEVEFFPEDSIPAVTVASAGTSAIAGEDAVAAAADNADAELEAVGMTSSAPGAARLAAETWSDLDTSVREVLVDVAQVTELIGTEIETLGLADRLALWQAYRSMLLLSDAVVAAARAATADVSRTMTVKVGRPVALRTLLATIYGAREVDQRYEQALSLNDISTPGWIATGTELRLPQPSSQPRTG